MDTIMNGRADVFRTIAADVANHIGAQLVLSIGDRLDPKQIGPVPSNAIIVNQAPQLELLKRASSSVVGIQFGRANLTRKLGSRLADGQNRVNLLWTTFCHDIFFVYFEPHERTARAARPRRCGACFRHLDVNEQPQIQ
jgi:hypothetical protein